MPRWIRLGPVQFQPSELAKLTVILFTAYHLARPETDLSSFNRGILVERCCRGASNDAGTRRPRSRYSRLHWTDLWDDAHPRWGSVAASRCTRRRRSRGVRGHDSDGTLSLSSSLEFFNPGHDPGGGGGYQVDQSLIALGSGGVGGVGLARSVQKLYFLPEAHTDFIFAIVGEELGLLGCLSLITLFVMFLWRGMRIAAMADSRRGAYLAADIVSMVVLQALINMSVVVRLLPTRGIPLPFISVGGSSLIVMLVASGGFCSTYPSAAAQGGLGDSGSAQLCGAHAGFGGCRTSELGARNTLRGSSGRRKR